MKTHPEMYTHRRGKKKKIQDNPQPVNQKIKIIHEKEIKIVRELKVVTKTKIEKPVRKKKQKVTYTTIWTPEDDALLIRLRSGGAYMRVLKEALPCHRQCDIDKRIQFLKSQNLLGSFSYGKKSINPPLIV